MKPAFVTVAGIVNQEMSQRMFATCTGLIGHGHSELHLLIQSTGGFIGDAVAINNFLRGLPIPVTTYNGGHIASAAVAVYLAGATRVAEDTASFMIHRPGNNAAGGNASAIASILLSLQIDEQRMSKILKAGMPSFPDDKWAVYAGNDLTFDAASAVTYGAVHSIGSFAPLKGATFLST